jgi:hypothetical protein
MPLNDTCRSRTLPRLRGAACQRRTFATTRSHVERSLGRSRLWASRSGHYARSSRLSRLEHFISERFEDRVAAILGDPEIDPHGHVIPQKYEAGVFREEVPLARWPVRTPALISSVSDRSAVALRELERLGLMPGAAVMVEQRNSAGSLSIRLADHADHIRLRNDLARCVLVTPNLAP